MEQREPENPLALQLRWLMIFRVVTATFLLITTIVVHFRDVSGVSEAAMTLLYGLIGSVYFLTFLYAVLLPHLANQIVQAHIQITGDVVINTGVIYLTGGLESAFSFMYILTIINAGILLKIRGAVIAASLSAILYGGLLDLHYYDYIEPLLTRFSRVDHYRALDIINTLLVNMGAFYLVAVLSGYLAKQSEESRRKLAQRQSDLERLERLNESIVQSIDSGLMTLGTRGEILSFNPAAERITGCGAAEVRGRLYNYVFPDLDLPVLSTGSNQEGLSWNWIFKRPDGEELYLDLGLFNLRDRSGGEGRRLLVFQDRTRIINMEEEVKRVERLALVGELAAGIAHEIRNPLASMSGSFQLLSNDFEEGSEQARLLAIIGRETERLNHIVNDFLMFARPRPGRPADFDVSNAVHDNLNIFEHELDQEGGIDIIRRISAGVQAHFDHQQFEQVMWNLLRNAAEAMPQGGTITVYLDKLHSHPAMVEVVVTDEGSGIPPKDLYRIFDPFYTTKRSGNGLGLSIVRTILESGGGTVTATSEPGQGASFKVLLPTAKNK